jgi:hypothetical protein
VTPFIADIHRHATRYARILGKDSDKGSPFAWLSVLDMTTAHPALLNVLEGVDDGRFSSAVVQQLSHILQTFYIRRAVCGVPTNQLRKIFGTLADIAATSENDDALIREGTQELLRKSRCPTDQQFADAIIRTPLYGGSKQKIVRYVLERMEREHGHKEPIDLTAAAIQIEHVLPQRPGIEWQNVFDSPEELPAEDRSLNKTALLEKWCHVLGNLTLTGYNSELGRRDFEYKKAEYTNSHLELNTYFQPIGKWGIPEIIQRGKHLADLAIRIWPLFGVPGTVPVRVRRRRSVPLRSVSLNGQVYEAKTHIDAAVWLLRRLSEMYPPAFQSGLKSVFKPYRFEPGSPKRAPRKISEDIELDLHGSADWIENRCIKLGRKLGLTRDAIHFERSMS